MVGLIEETYFEHNSKRLEKEYEEYVLTEGDFDERMYLSVLRQADFGVDPQQDYFKTIERQSLDMKTYPPLQEVSINFSIQCRFSLVINISNV